MINRVRNALLSVERIYLKYPAIGDIQKYGERVFAYEFYHQLRIRFNDLHLDITGEPIKGAGLLPDMDQTTVPDFVIHNYSTNDHNEIAIEVKVTPNLTARQIRGDLQKLANMINGPLGYNHGIFLVGNCNLINKINRSAVYRDDIINLIENTPQIIIWNTLPFEAGANMRETITEEELNIITLADFQ